MTGSAVEVRGTGFVSRHPLPAGPRVAVAPDGRLVCSYVGRGGAGTSDYALHLADSADGGATWTDRGPLWPDDAGVVSVTGSIARGRDGELTLFGTRTPLPADGGPWWDPVRQAIAANELFWSRSDDGGRTWSPRTVIPMPEPGSAEAPGPMLTTRGGHQLACYAPYPTFDESLEVDRARVLVVRSDDDGATWQGSVMLRLAPDGGTAEAWLVELSDGRLFGSCWAMDLRTGLDRPNPWAVSDDGGATWSPTRSLGIPGQAVGLTALDGGRVAMVYNQRDVARDPVGVWLAILEPGDDTVMVHADMPVWSAGGAATSDPDAIGHDAWQTFTFGEPGVAVLPDGELLVTIWSGVSGAEGVVWVRVRLA